MHKEIQGHTKDGRLHWIDTEVADVNPRDCKTVYSYDGNDFHITAEIAAILARGYGMEVKDVDEAVSSTDAESLIYGAVMLVRQQLHDALDGCGVLLDPLRRIAYYSQCKRLRLLRNRVRSQIHAKERLHGPCPKRLRNWIWKETLEYEIKYSVQAQEFYSYGKTVRRNGSVRCGSRGKIVVPHKKHRLRKLYEEWMNTRATKKAAAKEQ